MRYSIATFLITEKKA